MKHFFWGLCAVFPRAVFALEESAGYPELAVGSMLGSLLLVLICIFIFAYLMKKTNLLKAGQATSVIKVIATHVLSRKARVQMIVVNGQHYLLGVTEQNITLLDKLEKPEISEENTQTSMAAPFSALLSKMSKKSDA